MKIPNADEDMERKELSFIPDGNSTHKLYGLKSET